MEYEFSIIVPVYNAENYINNCIDSLIDQKDAGCSYEIILVNDGSTDNSHQILSQYERSHENIIVVSQRNQGVAAARNTGIKNARGRYILFVDSDDWIEDHTISAMHKWSSGADPDIIMFNYFHAYQGKKYEEQEIRESCAKRVGMDQDALYYMSYAYIWDKAYKREIIEDHGIRFERDVHFGEDTLFLCMYLMYIRTVVLIRDCLYNYRENDKGLSLSNKYVKDMDIVIDRIWDCHKKIEQNNPGFIKTAEKRHYYGTLCLQVIYNMYHIDSDLRIRERRQKLKQFFERKLYDSIVNETPGNIVKKYIVRVYKIKKVLPLDAGMLFFRGMKKMRIVFR